MHILILVQVFPPDNVATAQLYGELALEFRKAGHEVTVLTTCPHYMFDPEAKDWPLTRPFKFPFGSDCQHGIRVIRTWMPRKGRHPLYRIACWGWFHALSTLRGLVLRCGCDVILSPSPPPSIGLSAFLLARRHRVPFVYNVQELYPDVAINLGFLKNPLLIRFLLGMEAFIYRHAAALTVISEGMRRRILAKGVVPSKITMIPNFADLDSLQVLPRNNRFAQEHDLVGRFVVTYAGNMGKPQHLEVLLHAARQVRSDSRIAFVMLGDGAEREPLIRLAARLKLSNLRFLPSQPYHLMNEIYAASDLGFVPQATGTSADGVPSKAYRIMACGRPILASTDSSSDLARLVERSGGGRTVPPANPTALAEAILQSSADPAWCKQSGENARAYVAAHHSRKAVAKQYLDLLSALADAQ